ncbi:MAG TPA: type II toxin-antitoxin system death-on-curing family toxin [bacterium]|nr:type II toxin-antitoxin system death-on-curing family toxin [bacterium]
MIFRISINEVELVAHRMARELLRWDEPIPDFSTRYPNVLESCLSAPFQTYDKRSLYPTLIDQASILFYLIIKNHPFQNGNKRIAITTLFYFLSKNGKWVEVENQELYNFAVWVASSPPQFRDETLSAIKKFIKKNIVDA